MCIIKFNVLRKLGQGIGMAPEKLSCIVYCNIISANWQSLNFFSEQAFCKSSRGEDLQKGWPPVSEQRLLGEVL